MKHCWSCKTDKEIIEFHKCSREKDGYHRICKTCVKEYKQEYYLLNKDRLKAKAAKWNQENKPQRKEIAKKWKINNRDMVTASTVKRNSQKLLATPSWARPDKILQLYTEANKLSKETGIKYQVDHIVPLRSKLVCGLHCEDNLQVIPAIENNKKGNRYWPYKDICSKEA